MALTAVRSCTPVVGSAVLMSATSHHDVIMRLGITAHQIDGVSVLEIGGELDLWTAPALCSRIEESLRAPSSGVLIDLSQLQFCDSAGLRALAGVAREAHIRCARVLIVRPERSGAARAFELAGAAESLPLADDADSGVAALSQ